MAQHSGQRLGIAGWRPKPPQSWILVVVAGDDQRATRVALPSR
jgi:hypothetical protein